MLALIAAMTVAAAPAPAAVAPPTETRIQTATPSSARCAPTSWPRAGTARTPRAFRPATNPPFCSASRIGRTPAPRRLIDLPDGAYCLARETPLSGGK
jgi:hypothetical protein